MSRMVLVEDPKASWRENAACRAHPHPEWWFPVGGAKGTQAKAVCATCPVIAECDADAPTGVDTRYGGIWGGLSGTERVALRRAATPPDVVCQCCGTTFPYDYVGQVPRYCSKVCRERAGSRRRRGVPVADVAYERRVG